MAGLPAYNPWGTPVFPGDSAPQPYEGYSSPPVANILQQIAGALGKAFMAPGQALQSTTPITSDQMIAPAVNMATMMASGGMPMAERGALGMTGGRLPSSASLATPPAPTIADMARASRVENVPLSQARGTQPKMQWDKFNAGESPPPLIEGYADKPVAVRREDGEYLIFDGHHRAVKALNEGSTDLPMHVIDAKDYAPEFAGRKSAPDNISTDDLLKMLRD